jgi:hypothetical protein
LQDDREPNEDLAETRTGDAKPEDAKPEGGTARLAIVGRIRSRIGGRIPDRLRDRVRGLRLPGGRRVAIRGREVSLVPRTVAVVLLVGLLGFVLGTQYGIAGRPAPATSPPIVAAATPSATATLQPSAVSAVTVAAGSSAMAVWFDPPRLVSATKDASACGVQVGPNGTGGAWWQRIWFAHCRLAPAGRDRIIDELGKAMSDGLLTTDLTGSGGYLVSSSGPEIGHWAYESGSIEGSIQLLRYDAGSDVDLVFVISEHVKD